MREAAVSKTDTEPLPGGGQRLRDTGRAPDVSGQRVEDLALSWSRRGAMRRIGPRYGGSKGGGCTNHARVGPACSPRFSAVERPFVFNQRNCVPERVNTLSARDVSPEAGTQNAEGK